MTQTLRELVDFLCSSQCLPRTPGSPGSRRAVSYLERALSGIGLEPRGEDGYRQEIEETGGVNLVGASAGTDRGAERWIILGAHHDVCDILGEGFPGADDNAAAVAIVLEVARLLQTTSRGRSTLFCLFDAEEPPYFLGPTMGSRWFVDHPTIPLNAVDLMICLDVVGRALGPPSLPAAVRDSIFVLGAEKGAGIGELVDALPPVDGLEVRRLGSHVVPPMSDYQPFWEADIPFLFHTCGRSAEYHTVDDTPDKLDYDKMARLVTHLAVLIETLANSKSDPIWFLPHGEDDAATVAAVLAIVDRLPESEVITAAREELKHLAAVAAQRPLTPMQRDVLQMMVLGVESLLA